MKRKRILVMGFMGSCPIAGVIWQHVHYIVGLQRLGHDVYYIEDSARLPYNPETFEVNDEFDYAARILRRLSREFEFKNRWAFCARYLPGNPTAGLPLRKIRQPVVTDLWRTNRSPSRAAVFTTVANWSTSGLKDISWRGRKYLWSKSREFLRFIAAPKKAGETFELAANIDHAATRTKFERNGWRLRCPLQMSVDYWLYRDYIQHSKGEFTVAKDQYVRLNLGWFSDRSACYLAAGRPVITQETAFTKIYGAKAGLLSFITMGEIVER